MHSVPTHRTVAGLAALVALLSACGAEQTRSPTEAAHVAGPQAEGGHSTRELSEFGRGATAPLRIAEGVYQAQAVGNTNMVVTSEGNVVIDTGLPPRQGVREGDIPPRELLGQVSDGPTKYVIVTHAHQDHMGNTDAWMDEGTEIIAHKTFRETQRYLTELVPFFMARNQPLYPNEIPRALLMAGDMLKRIYPNVQPTIEVDDVFAFELGGRKFEVIHTPGAEGEDSICVWMPEEKILFTGDLFGPLFPMFPNLYTIRGEKFRWPVAYIESLDKVLALEPEILVPSHFEPIVGKEKILAGVRKTRDATRYVHDATVAGMNDGKDVYTLMREIKLPPHLDLSEGHGKVSWSVRGIWEAYSGFFKYRSTTELYDVPRHYLDAELVELIGGADATVERAQAHLAEGRPLQALHYTDMALASEAGHRGALEARLAALELLMERSGDENHSEVLWLGHRISATRDELGLNDDA